MINALAGMGLAGGAVLALWLAASRVLGNRLPARWHYRVLKTSLFFFLVPVGRLLPLAGRTLSALRPAPAAPVPVPAPAVPKIPVTVLPRMPVTAPAAPVVPQVLRPEAFSVTAETLRALAVVWAVGAAAVLAYKAYVYIRLRRRVLRRNRPVSSKEAQLVFWACKRRLGVRGLVDLRENPAVRSPFAAGLLRPVVVVPSAELGREELYYLFSHELTHIKSGDLWVRFGALLAQVLHWYNPLVYLLSRNIQTVSEQSCDERVACPLSPEERYVYGNVILKLAAGAAAGSGDWAASLSTRESMERRLIRVLKTEKLRGRKRLAALVLAAAILACGGGAALAARNPLPVSREVMEPPRTAAALPAESGEKSGGSAANLNAAKPSGAAPAAAAAPKEDGTEKPEEPKPGKPVTPNGTPSEAFLRELREYFADCGVTEDTPVLFGDHELIVSRGGTLLPDEEFSSYTCTYGGSENKPPVIYKMFETKPTPHYINESGTISAEYYVGNKETLQGFGLKNLEQLVNGEYPKNSKGESYGSSSFGRYVGYYPDLVLAQGTKGESGYLYAPDEGDIPHNLPKDECPHSFLVPLYDKEHNEIGKFEMSCAGHIMEDVIAQGLSLEEAKAALAAGADSCPEPTYDDPSQETLAKIREAWDAAPDTPIFFGDRELILSRGGTLLPDDDRSSYMGMNGALYKLFTGKDGMGHVEYEVGNMDLLDEYQREALSQLVNGEYPRNSKGESYGSEAFFAAFVGYAPDLNAARGEGGVSGYIRERDELGYALRKAGDIAGYTALWKANPGPQPMPLYDSEGEVIGTFMHGGGYGPEDLGTEGMSVEEAKAAVEAFFEEKDAG